MHTPQCKKRQTPGIGSLAAFPCLLRVGRESEYDDAIFVGSLSLRFIRSTTNDTILRPLDLPLMVRAYGRHFLPVAIDLLRCLIIYRLVPGRNAWKTSMPIQGLWHFPKAPGAPKLAIESF